MSNCIRLIATQQSYGYYVCLSKYSRDILVKVMFWQRKQQYFLQKREYTQFKIVKYDTGGKVTMFIWDRRSYFLSIELRSICAHMCDWRTYPLPMPLFTL